ncbi:MAG: ABC transporter permease [Limosilactobacillus sp.]|nr:ABC transporter permease [Limosilactobacillus sp.]
MFLALKEMKHEKLRYGLVALMITLISYLVFVLAALALGLAQQGYQALDTWGVQSAVLSKSSDQELRQSTLTPAQVKKLQADNDKTAVVGISSIITQAKGREKVAATLVGTPQNQFVAKSVQLAAGHRINGDHQVIVDTNYQTKGYKLGDKITLGPDQSKYKIVGFAKDSMLQIAPVVYTTIPVWQANRGTGKVFAGSAVVSKQAKVTVHDQTLASYQIQKVIDKLPGYSAQNLTFGFMIGFLLIISLIVIAIFLYIITMQKLGNYAVLRAQGMPGGLLIRATLAQAVVLTVLGVAIALIASGLTAMALPAAVPMAFQPVWLALISLGFVVMSLLGSLIPVRMVAKVDPVTVIGG